MEPNKFEKHIKDKFQEREIKPSSNAWEKISSKLEAPVENRKSPFVWYSIAASFIGVLLVSFFYFSSENEQNIPNTQVVEDSSNEEIEEVKDIGTDILVESATKTKVVDITRDIATKKIKEKSVQKIKQEILIPDAGIALLEKEVSTNKNIQKENGLPDDIIDVKALEVVAEVNSLEENAIVSDSEVDSLLRKAQREILINKLFNKTKSVDAMALLTQVEDELDQSFREKVFESLKEKFLQARTAVANRNN